MEVEETARCDRLWLERGQKRKRRRLSEEYKAETVRLMRSSGQSMGQMALELGIGETALRRWAQQAEVEAGRGPAGALKRSEREELAELRRENQRLRMEREILKKATAFFESLSGRRPVASSESCLWKRSWRSPRGLARKAALEPSSGIRR